MSPAKPFTIAEFLKTETASSVILIIAAVLSMIIANSPLAHGWHELLETHIIIGIPGTIIVLDHSLEWWINDGLMAIFFFLIGLEVKRELVEGELSTAARASLPTIAAIGGMVVPALIYLGFNYQEPATARGWAIPAATDIAFAVGVLMFLGDRVPKSIRAFLLALAIIDDLGAILIIAIFFAKGLHVTWLGVGMIFVLAMLVLNMLRIRSIWPYIVLSICIWFIIIQSGIHPTIAGVICAFCIPLRKNPKTGVSMAHTIEDKIQEPVVFIIMPVFALANAGLSLTGLAPQDVIGTVPIGIALGLLVGKPLGVFGISYLAIKLGFCSLPNQATWTHLLGVSFLTGIGFTMSLFIGNLAFPGDSIYTDGLRVGVLSGSILAAVIGYLYINRIKTISPQATP
ncbi:MAG: Na+/H+ antiporter NhaA [Pseudomonadota bacterium]